MLRFLFSLIFPSSRKETRLRHLLHLGSVMEGQAEVFYRRFAEQAQDAEVSELYETLADEETNHFKLIQDILSNWKPLPIKSSDLEALDADRDYLTAGGVFTGDMIDAYIELKMEEITRLRMTTHPVEFDLYYSC